MQKRFSKIVAFTVCLVLSIGIFSSLIKIFEINNSLSLNKRVVYYTRDEIPEKYKVNLNDIYDTNQRINEDIEFCSLKIQSIENDLKNGLSFESIDIYFILDQIATKLNNYIQLNKLIDSKASIAQESQIAEIFNKKNEIYHQIRLQIFSKSEADLSEYLAGNNKYSEFIKYLIDHKNELSYDNDNFDVSLESAINETKYEFESLNNGLDFPNIKYSDGSEGPLSYNTFIACMQNKNRKLREKTYYQYYNEYLKNQDAFASILFRRINNSELYCKYKGFEDTLTYSLKSTDMNKFVFDNAIDAINDMLPLFWEFHGLKSNQLGLKNINMFDVYVSPYRTSNRYIPYEDAQRIILDALQPLGKEYVDLVNMMFNERWIDVYSTKDKDQNSMQIDFYGEHPYILINYQGTENDIYTLIHEIGHAAQSYLLSRNVEYYEFGVPEFLIEIPSTLNELLLSEYFYKNSTNDDERKYYTYQYLEKFRINVFRQAQIAEFESAMYKTEQSVDFFKSVYLEINKKYYGDNVISDDYISIEWARLSSLYMNFYSYQYVTSFGIAMNIIQNFENYEYHLDVLLVSKYDNPMDVLKRINIDIESKEIYSPLNNKYQELLSNIK